MKNYLIEKTKNPDLARIVDLEGNWNHYLHIPTNTVLRSVNYVGNMGYAKGERFYLYLMRHTESEAEKILKETGERGTKVHNAIERALTEWKFGRWIKVFSRETKKEEVLSNDEWDCMLAFQEFWNRHKPILFVSEYAQFNLKIGYAGTPDVIVKLTESCGVKSCGCDAFIGKIGIFDWKTGSGIYSDQGAKIAAYANCESLEWKIEYTAVIRLGTKHVYTGGYEAEFYGGEETKTHYAEFLAAKQIADAEYNLFDLERELKDIPEEIMLVQTKAKKPKKTKNVKRTIKNTIKKH